MYTPEERTVIYETAVKGENGKAGLTAIRGGGTIRTLSLEEDRTVTAFLSSLEKKHIFIVTFLSDDYPEL